MDAAAGIADGFLPGIRHGDYAGTDHADLSDGIISVERQELEKGRSGSNLLCSKYIVRCSISAGKIEER